MGLGMFGSFAVGSAVSGPSLTRSNFDSWHDNNMRVLGNMGSGAGAGLGLMTLFGIKGGSSLGSILGRTVAYGAGLGAMGGGLFSTLSSNRGI